MVHSGGEGGGGAAGQTAAALSGRSISKLLAAQRILRSRKATLGS
jgi:hypothetical protein